MLPTADEMGTVAFPGSEVPNKHVGREKIPGIPFKNNPAPDKHVNKQSAYTPPQKKGHTGAKTSDDRKSELKNGDGFRPVCIQPNELQYFRNIHA